jgi:hypothetical protein
MWRPLFPLRSFLPFPLPARSTVCFVPCPFALAKIAVSGILQKGTAPSIIRVATNSDNRLCGDVFLPSLLQPLVIFCVHRMGASASLAEKPFTTQAQMMERARVHTKLQLHKFREDAKEHERRLRALDDLNACLCELREHLLGTALPWEPIKNPWILVKGTSGHEIIAFATQVWMDATTTRVGSFDFQVRDAKSNLQDRKMRMSSPVDHFPGSTQVAVYSAHIYGISKGRLPIETLLLTKESLQSTQFAVKIAGTDLGWIAADLFMNIKPIAAIVLSFLVLPNANQWSPRT